MPGTAAGARKGWKTRTAPKPESKKRARSVNQVLGRVERLAALQAESTKATDFISGLTLQIQKIDEEYVPALKDYKSRVSVYQQMGNNAKIAAQLKANILPLFSASRAKVTGGTQEMRDLISQNLLREGDPRYWCETGWNQRLLEKLLSLQYGFSLHGKTWDVVDGYRIHRGLTYLHPKSLGGPLGTWEWDKTGTRLVAIHRAYRRPDMQQVVDERIPIEEIDASVWWHTGENWEGSPIIRAMYGAFVKFDLASKIGMIALMNGGVGIPMGTLGPSDGPAQQLTLSQQSKDLRGGDKSRSFLVLANGQTMEFLTTKGQIIDAQPMLAQQNMDIASAGSTDFMQAGQTASGSRAGSSVMMVSYMQQLDATRKWLQEQINHGSGYLMGTVEELIYENFADVKECPQIELSQISPTEQLDNVPLIFEGTQKGTIPRTLKITNYCLDKLGAPTLTQAEFDASVGGRSVVDIGTPSGNPEAPPPGDQPAKVPGNGGAGRPNEVAPTDGNNPRKDKLGRAFGLTAEKKTSDETSQAMSRTSYPWLKSTPASRKKNPPTPSAS